MLVFEGNLNEPSGQAISSQPAGISKANECVKRRSFSHNRFALKILHLFPASIKPENNVC